MDVYGLTSFHQWCTVFCRDIKETVELSSLCQCKIYQIYLFCFCLSLLSACLFVPMHAYTFRPPRMKQIQVSIMAQWLIHLPMDKKVLGSIPGSTLLCSFHNGGLNNHIQTREVYFYCLPPRLSDETLNRSPESMAYLVPARSTIQFPFKQIFTKLH